MTTQKTRTKKSRCVKMSVQETHHFISEVKQHKCLWDHTDEQHKSRWARDKAWEELSINMKRNADDLFAKWNSLRASFRQYRCVLRKRAKKDPDAVQVIKWPFFSAMGFTINEDSNSDPPAISLPTKLVPEESKLVRSFKRPLVQAPNPLHSVPKVLPNIGRINPQPAGLVKRPKIVVLSSRSSFKPVPTAVAISCPSRAVDRSLPNQPGASKEPEFIAVKVEAPSNPSSPVEQTFYDDVQGSNVRKAKDEDDVWGHSIALQMKQFSPRTKRKLQIQIQELIAATQKQAFEKDFGIAYDS